MWETSVFGRNELKPPVVYGIHPKGAEAAHPYEPAVPLESGVTYTVKLHVTARDFSPFLLAGEASFTP
jgi:hypothetical protein